MFVQYVNIYFSISVEKGCFKCGAPDHIAKDCTGSPTAKHQPAKYILKDDNTQRGSDSKSRFVIDAFNDRSLHDLPLILQESHVVLFFNICIIINAGMKWFSMETLVEVHNEIRHVEKLRMNASPGIPGTETCMIGVGILTEVQNRERMRGMGVESIHGMVGIKVTAEGSIQRGVQMKVAIGMKGSQKIGVMIGMRERDMQKLHTMGTTDGTREITSGGAQIMMFELIGLMMEVKEREKYMIVSETEGMSHMVERHIIILIVTKAVGRSGIMKSERPGNAATHDI